MRNICPRLQLEIPEKHSIGCHCWDAYVSKSMDGPQLTPLASLESAGGHVAAVGFYAHLPVSLVPRPAGGSSEQLRTYALPPIHRVHANVPQCCEILALKPSHGKDRGFDGNRCPSHRLSSVTGSQQDPPVADIKAARPTGRTVFGVLIIVSKEWLTDLLFYEPKTA
jgi:hypothetical protein